MKLVNLGKDPVVMSWGEYQYELKPGVPVEVPSPAASAIMHRHSEVSVHQPEEPPEAGTEPKPAFEPAEKPKPRRRKKKS